MKKILLAILPFSVALYCADGANIFSSKCYSCHGESGQLKCFGKSKVINLLDSKTIYESLVSYKAGEKNEYGLGSIMKAQVATFSNDDFKALSDYIPTLKK